MRFCTFREYGGLAAGVLVGDRVVPLDDLNEAWGQDFGPDVGSLIRRRQVDELRRMLANPPRLATSGWRPENMKYVAPYRNPPKIWGVGRNFDDRGETGEPSRLPATFMRPPSAIADPGQPLQIPKRLENVTGGAELLAIVGDRIRNATPEEAREGVLGFGVCSDLVAQGLMDENPHHLTHAKAFDTFFPVGSWIVTRDEWEPTPDTGVRTLLNGKVVAENKIGNMRMSPYELIAHYSETFAWEPGDMLLTGTPGTVTLQSGDTLTAEVDGLPGLSNPVA